MSIYKNFDYFSNWVFYIFKSHFYLHQNPVKLTLPLRKIYTYVAIRLKGLPLYLLKLIVNSFGIIGFLLAINTSAFWMVVPCNLVKYRSVVGEYVT